MATFASMHKKGKFSFMDMCVGLYVDRKCIENRSAKIQVCEPILIKLMVVINHSHTNQNGGSDFNQIYFNARGKI